jgi:hypothetical protein
MLSTQFHEITATGAYHADCVNHYTAAINKTTNEMEAVYNDKTRTVQVFTDGYEVLGNYKPVKANSRNDARPMFTYSYTPKGN